MGRKKQGKLRVTGNTGLFDKIELEGELEEGVIQIIREGPPLQEYLNQVEAAATTHIEEFLAQSPDAKLVTDLQEILDLWRDPREWVGIWFRDLVNSGDEVRVLGHPKLPGSVKDAFRMLMRLNELHNILWEEERLNEHEKGKEGGKLRDASCAEKSREESKCPTSNYPDVAQPEPSADSPYIARRAYFAAEAGVALGILATQYGLRLEEPNAGRGKKVRRGAQQGGKERASAERVRLETLARAVAEEIEDMLSRNPRLSRTEARRRVEFERNLSLSTVRRYHLNFKKSRPE